MAIKYSGYTGMFENPKCLSASLERNTRLANSMEKRTLFLDDGVFVSQLPLTGAYC